MAPKRISPSKSNAKDRVGIRRYRDASALSYEVAHRTYVVTLWPTAQKLWAFLRNARVELVEAGAVVLHPNGDVLIDPPVFGQCLGLAITRALNSVHCLALGTGCEGHQRTRIAA